MFTGRGGYRIFPGGRGQNYKRSKKKIAKEGPGGGACLFFITFSGTHRDFYSILDAFLILKMNFILVFRIFLQSKFS